MKGFADIKPWGLNTEGMARREAMQGERHMEAEMGLEKWNLGTERRF